MKYYPAYLNLRGCIVLVIGGGSIAEGKIRQFIEAGARVRVVSPTLTDSLNQLVENGEIEHVKTVFKAIISDEIFKDVRLVMAATNDQEANDAAAQAAVNKGLFCNVVDQTELCTFITPALVNRGDIQISVSTGGGSPSLAKRIKREIAESIGDEYITLLEIAKDIRAEAKILFPDFDERKVILQAFIDSDALELIRDGKVDEARQLSREFLTQRRESNKDAKREEI